ncbi:MAG: suppressor of fused domain protein [Planctomycetes bacterium]|nr:suppressor of fused domain protein [Planctomycetota bacterium]MCB9887599.1 suppressor of fused domain protein [Planctomycetota bacterium]
MDDAFAQWFEQVWTEREEKVYRSIFGDLGGGVLIAGESVYARFGKAPHSGWFNHGVFACPPNPERETWLYVTSGLSNPWNLQAPGRDPSGFSGVGFELVVESAQEADWAPPLLHNLMAYELLVAVGSYEGAELFEYGNRIPLQGSITPSFDSAIRWLLVEQPKHYPSAFELPSGRVDFFHLVGATDAEVEFARQTSQDMLVGLLRKQGVHPRTDADRVSCK